MRNEIAGIFRGQVFATPAGEEFTVVDLVPKSGYAVIENLHDEPGVIGLTAMLAAIESGVLVNVNADDETCVSATDIEEESD